MAIQTIAYLKSKFETGDKPTQQDFYDLLDTMFSLGGSSSFNPENITTDLKFANTTSNRILERRRLSGSILQYLSQIQFGDNDLRLIVEDWATGGVLKDYASYQVIGGTFHNWIVGNVPSGVSNSMQLLIDRLNLNKPARYSSALSLVNDLDLVYKKWVEDNFPKLVSGLIPTVFLPSYVDDVLEFANLAAFPVTGESGKIYISIDTNFQYRWSGSAYVQITSASAVWGAISGSLASQTDLQAALNARLLVTDIINILTDASTNKALSAAQGKLLKDTADALATTVAAKATDSLVVHLAGSETLTGKKTFSAGLKLPASQSIQGASDIAVLEPVNASGSDTSFWRFSSGIATIVASAQGALSNIGKTFQTKGTGVFSFVTNTIERFKIGGGGELTASSLAGAGTRVTTVDPSGNLSATLETYDPVINQQWLALPAFSTFTENTIWGSDKAALTIPSTIINRLGNVVNIKYTYTLVATSTATSTLLLKLKHGSTVLYSESISLAAISGTTVNISSMGYFQTTSLGASGVLKGFVHLIFGATSYFKYIDIASNLTIDSILTETAQVDTGTFTFTANQGLTLNEA